MKETEKLRRTIKSRQAYLDYDNKTMACYMHMSPSSWDRRLRKPEILTFKELILLEKVLKIKLMQLEVDG